MKIFSIALNMHDHNTYDGSYHRQEERYSRLKHNLMPDNKLDPLPSRKFFLDHFIPNYRIGNSIIAFTYSNLGRKYILDLLESHLSDKKFLSFIPKNLWDHCLTDEYYYIDHHQSHAAYAFLSSGFTESDVLAIDGQGCTYSCIFVDKHGTITDLSDRLSIGGLWNLISQRVGLGYLGAGKLMGLAGYGKIDEDIKNIVIEYLKNPVHWLPDSTIRVIEAARKEDVAFTLQQVTVDLIKEIVIPLKTSPNICIAGGVAYNGYMNEEFTKHWQRVHVPPAAGDEGQSIGTYMHADYVINKNISIPSVYAGKRHNVNEHMFDGLLFRSYDFDELVEYVADNIAGGKIVGWFQGKSESGNRALGNRSILADPRTPDIKDIINSRIKLREDFRPFAPSVLEDHYKDYFRTNQPSPYMSRIVPVISDKIPGVTHVDGTARIQTVTKDFNQRYYKLIESFYKITGIPMLLNTSFNCQEPIVETPEEAVRTFRKCGLDLLVIDDYIIEKKND